MKTDRAWRAALLALACAWSFAASAIEPSAVRIEGDAIAESLSGKPGDPTRGRAVVTNRQIGACLLCHTGPFPEERFQGSIAPDLKGVGARLTDAQIRLRVVDPAKANAETIMPSYFVVDGLIRVGKPWRGKPALSAEQVEDVVALLATLREP